MSEIPELEKGTTQKRKRDETGVSTRGEDPVTEVVGAKPSSIISLFTAQDGTRTGPPIEIPMSSTAKQLDILINTLLENTEPLPYAFYLNDMEILSSLDETIQSLAENGQGVSYEDALVISYQPLSVYRVRPVTRCVETMPGHTDAVIHVSYSPNGQRLASGGGDAAVRFWNVTTSMPTHTCLGHRNHILCAVWTPDGETFISADRNGEIRLWDPKTGSAKGQPLKGHRKWVTSLACEPYHADPRCVRIASASKDHTVRVWNIATGRCETVVSGHSDSVETVKWGGNGLLYTCSRDRTIMVWEIDGHGKSAQKLMRTLTGHAHRINTLALSCDYVLRTGWYEFGPQSSSTDLSMEEKQQKALERYQLIVGSEGERLVSGSDDFTLFLWKPSESKSPVTRMTGHQQLVNHIVFSPDSRFIASASFDKKIKIWCGKTGRFLHTLSGHVNSVYQISWSADSVFIVSASKDSTLKLWSMKSPKKAVETLAGHADEVYSVDWSPDGTQVASGSKDRTIKIWHH